MRCWKDYGEGLPCDTRGIRSPILRGLLHFNDAYLEVRLRFRELPENRARAHAASRRSWPPPPLIPRARGSQILVATTVRNSCRRSNIRRAARPVRPVPPAAACHAPPQSASRAWSNNSADRGSPRSNFCPRLPKRFSQSNTSPFTKSVGTVAKPLSSAFSRPQSR